MMSTYKGDSLGKKANRAHLWVQTARWMQTLNQDCTGVLVLAGHGGDISTLKGLGISPEKIIAVDLAKDAAEYCKELYPGIETAHGDVAEVCKTVSYNAAHLDFCNGLSVDNLRTIKEVMLNADDTAYISITMMKGREFGLESKDKILPKVSPKELRVHRKDCIDRKDWIAAHFLDAKKPFDPRKMIEAGAKKVRVHFTPKLYTNKHGEREELQLYSPTGKNLTGLGLAVARASVLHEILNACVWYHGIRIKPVLVTTYQSRTKHGNGTPFYTVGFVVSREERVWLKVRKMLSPATSFSAQFMRMFSLLKGEEEISVRRIAIELAGSGMYSSEEVANILDINHMKVAAWKAHATMGSYDDEDRTKYMNMSTIGHHEEQPDGTFITPVDPKTEGPVIARIREELGWAPEVELEVVSGLHEEHDSGWGLPATIGIVRVKGGGK